MIKKTIAFSCSLASLLLTSHNLQSDEGMWPFNKLPKEQIYEKYGVQLNDNWIEHVQRSCLRISLGGSGSLVSPNGLVMTNHHVGSKAIYNLSTENNNLMEKGFYARSLEEELVCPNMYMDQLITIEDITPKINAQLTENMSLAEKEKARSAAIASIKKQAEEQTGLEAEVVTLYQGAQYHLYLYKRYTDIRLVMAPEKSIAYFGGDEENFEYPRYNLDVCFFRIYENGKPIENVEYLKWSGSGPKIGEALFVAGNPGSTNRTYTSDHLKFLQQMQVPLILDLLEERIAALESFSQTSEEHKRIALQDLFRYRNAEKVYQAYDRGLNQSPIIANKQSYEKTLFEKLPVSKQKPWIELAAAIESLETFYPEYFSLEGIGSGYSKMYIWSKQLIRYSEEIKKPNEERLKPYTDTELKTLEMQLLTEEPFYIELDQVILVDSFNRMREILGENHPAVIEAFQGKSSEEVAMILVENTQIFDRNYRKALFENPENVQKSQDAFLLFAKILDPYARALYERYEAEFISIQTNSYTEIVQTLFEEYGDSIYPDATFTLRLSTGSMKGYKEANIYIKPMTQLSGVFKQSSQYGQEPPYKLPNSWISKQQELKPTIPFNFVSTNDIIGGNSGSPVINAKGEVVGLIFDGNAQSLTWDFEFNEVQGRAISVHSEAIIEALKTIYGAEDLVIEIQTGKILQST